MWYSLLLCLVGLIQGQGHCSSFVGQHRKGIGNKQSLNIVSTQDEQRPEETADYQLLLVKPRTRL